MKHFIDDMPLYAAGQLSHAAAVALEKHLEDCADCRAELYFWQTLQTEIRTEDLSVSMPEGLAERALEQIHVSDANSQAAVMPGIVKRLRTSFQRAFNLLRAQAYLVKREIWPASASIMALGVILGLVSKHVEAISFIIPLVTAASLAMLYGFEYDPAHELVLSTPTSAWKILLARLSVVSAYDLLLALASSLPMLLIVPPDVLGMIILGWLAPTAFLSALALLLSIWAGTGKAIVISYGLWILQYLKLSKILLNGSMASAWDSILNAYREFWRSPGLLLILSAVLLGIALLSTRFSDRGMKPVLS